MKGLWEVLGCGVCFAFGLIGLSPTSFAQDESINAPTVKIRYIIPLSGDAAIYGEAARHGVMMALEQIPDSERIRIRVNFDDDGFKPVQAVSAFKKAVAVDAVDCVVNFGSATSNAIAPLAESEGVPLIAVASDPRISRSRKWSVNFWVSPESETDVLIPEALRRGIQSVVLAATEQEGVLAVRDAFLGRNNGRMSIVADQSFPPDVHDFKPFLNRVRREQNVDGYLLILLPPQLGIFAKQARQLGITAPFLGYETFEDRNEIEQSGGALLGAWYVTGDDPGESFSKAYLARHPNGIPAFSSVAHDTVILVRNALNAPNSAQRSSREQIRNYLMTAKDVSGALGSYSATGDNRFTLKAVAKQVTKEGFEKINDGGSRPPERGE